MLPVQTSVHVQGMGLDLVCENNIDNADNLGTSVAPSLAKTATRDSVLLLHVGSIRKALEG